LQISPLIDVLCYELLYSLNDDRVLRKHLFTVSRFTSQYY